MKRRFVGYCALVLVFSLTLCSVSALSYNDDLEENAGRYFAFNQFFLDHFASCANGSVDYLSNYTPPADNTTTALASAAPKDRMKYIADNNWIPIAAYSPESNVMSFYFAGEQDLDYGEEDIIQLDKDCANKSLADFVTGHSESDSKALADMVKASKSFDFYLDYKPDYELPGISGTQAAADSPVSAVYANFGAYINLFPSTQINVTLGEGATLPLSAPVELGTLTLDANSILDLSALKAADLASFDKITKISADGAQVKFPADASAADKETFLELVEGDCEEYYAGWSDVAKTDWFYNAVRFVAEQGLMDGTGNDKFSPMVTMSRGMLVTVLYRLEGKPAVSGDIPFSDVSAGQWYSDPILWASENKIVEGRPNGTFGLNDPVTREQAVTILYRYAQSKEVDVSVGEDTNILSYPDAFDISEYAIPAMQWACGAGVMLGRSNGNIDPQGSSNRAEIATIFMRYVDFLSE